jgi:hypothetical protein
MFHDVRDLECTKFPERYKLKSFLSKEAFEKRIDYIARNYEVISSEQAIQVDLKKGNNKYAVLTFDDGLLDHYYVYNYLKQRGLTATFFVPVEAVFHNKIVHSHKIQFILAAVEESKLVDDILSNFSNRDELWDRYSKTAWKDNWWTKEMVFVTNFLRKHNEHGFSCKDCADILFRRYVSNDEAAFCKDLYLAKEHVEEIANSNFTIGGHGYTSNSLLLERDFDFDIRESTKVIKQYADFLCFSYPHGGFNEQIKQSLVSNGYSLSYTVNQFTVTELDILDPMEFPRYDAPQRILL